MFHDASSRRAAIKVMDWLVGILHSDMCRFLPLCHVKGPLIMWIQYPCRLFLSGTQVKPSIGSLKMLAISHQFHSKLQHKATLVDTDYHKEFHVQFYDHGQFEKQ